MDIEIKHDKQGQEFFINLDGDTAELSYARPRQDVIDFQHTFVPESFQGRGVAFKLIKHGLNFARNEGLKVIATCEAVQVYFDRNPSEKDLLL